MDEKRLSRYREKMSLINKRRDNINSWIPHRDEKSVLAIYKAFQEMIEAFTDIFAMALKDMGELVQDDYSNIERLCEKSILGELQGGIMKEANGLRNRLVHEYNGLVRGIALESVKNVILHVDEILEDIEIWMKNCSKK